VSRSSKFKFKIFKVQTLSESTSIIISSIVILVTYIETDELQLQVQVEIFGRPSTQIFELYSLYLDWDKKIRHHNESYWGAWALERCCCTIQPTNLHVVLMLSFFTCKYIILRHILTLLTMPTSNSRIFDKWARPDSPRRLIFHKNSDNFMFNNVQLKMTFSNTAIKA
jgi:hypothetical protein